jgi:polysaccharide export outer membrane protein
LITATALLGLAVPPVAIAQPPAPKSDDAAAYRINAGDQIEIYVWGDERLQRGLTVLPDGSFAFPLVGTVQAQGRTPTDIEAEISRRLAEQYKGEAPQVTVSVKVPSGNQISVIGKVRTPGTFSSSRNINVLDALTLAGGPSEFADVGNIVILRQENGKTTSFRVHLSNVLKGKPSASDLSDNGIPELRAGDTVIVP